MTLLLGIELREACSQLTVVDRRGEIVAALSGQLEESTANWSSVHPEVYYRGVVQLLTDAVRSGVFDPLRVAAIGLGVEPAVVFLDADLEVVSPREIGWAEHLENETSLRDAFANLTEAQSRWPRRAGVLFSLLDFLRYRMTGAIASHESFAVSAGLAASPARRTEWNIEWLQELGVRRDALPPIFDATWRVGVVGPELGREIGFGRNVWVGGGSDPHSARLLVTAEPVPGSRVLQLEAGGCSVWRVGGVEESFVDGGLPLPVEGLWYYPAAGAIEDPRRAEGGWTAPDAEQWTIDSRLEQSAADWRRRPEGDVWFAWDCGGPTAGVAIQAGMGLGWWRDLRGLWRKRRAPIDYEDWYNSLLEPEPEPDDDGGEAGAG